MSTARLLSSLSYVNPWPVWEQAQQRLDLKTIQLSWDFIDTVCCAGFEWGSILTDLLASESALFTPSLFTAGLGIGVVLAYCEYLAHKAQNDLIDPDASDTKFILKNPDEKANELSTLQKFIIATETITHTTEKANGVTQLLRLGVSLFANGYPEFRKHERMAKGFVHCAALTGAFFGSGQEAKNIEIAFKRQNQMEHERGKLMSKKS